MNGRLDLRKKFFSVRSSSKWNMVPPEIKRTMPALLFKKAYRKHRESLMPISYSRQDKIETWPCVWHAYQELMFYKRAYLVHGELHLKQTNIHIEFLRKICCFSHCLQ